MTLQFDDDVTNIHAIQKLTTTNQPTAVNVFIGFHVIYEKGIRRMSLCVCVYECVSA